MENGTELQNVTNIGPTTAHMMNITTPGPSTAHGILTIPFHPDFYNSLTTRSETDRILWFLSQIICCVGIIGNFCVIFVVIFERTFHKATFIVLAFLAVSDALTLICQSLQVSVLFTGAVDANSLEAKILILLTNFVLLISSYHILYISILRYFIIVHPLKTYIYLNIKTTVLISAAIYTVIPTVAFVTYLAVFKLSDNNLNQYYFLLVSGILYFTPVILMAGFHIAKCRTLHNRKFHTCEATLRKMSHTILVIIVMSCVLPVPLLVATVYIFTGNNIQVELVVGLKICFFTKHAVNPIVYSFMSAKFRQSFKRLCVSKCLFWCCNSPDDNNVATYLMNDKGRVKYVYEFSEQMTKL